MLLYWGMFTVGFIVGAILSFMMFAAKNPEEDPDYSDQIIPKSNSGTTTQNASQNSKGEIIVNPI